MATLRVAAMRESLERVGRFDPQRARDRFLATFAPEHTRHLIAGGERAGCVAARPVDGVLLLEHLYVLPAHQRRGIGGAVLAELFAQADAAGVALRVGALRGSAANAFYVRHGFMMMAQTEWDNHYERPGCAAA